jgi:hypothetical protein
MLTLQVSNVVAIACGVITLVNQLLIAPATVAQQHLERYAELPDIEGFRRLFVAVSIALIGTGIGQLLRPRVTYWRIQLVAALVPLGVIGMMGQLGGISDTDMGLIGGFWITLFIFVIVSRPGRLRDAYGLAPKETQGPDRP